MADEWKRDRIERDRRVALRKTLDAAETRMRQRTAREQLTDAMAASRAPLNLPDPEDGDDASAQRGVLR